MRDELERLQELLRDNQTRLAAIEIKNRQEFPPMQIVDYAAWPRNPIHPNYWRDAGLVTVVSLLLGLFMAWLVDYLSERNRREEAPLTTTGVRVYAGESKPAIDAPPAADPALEMQPAATALPNSLARELELAELQALLAAAPADIRAAIGLLLSGLAPAEFDGLAAVDFDPAVGRLSLGGDGARDLPLAPGVQRWLQEPDVPDRLEAHSAEEVRAAVTVAAVDAGVVDPATVTPEALRHTYLLYLVRQGARLGELARLVGPVSAVQLQKYGRYSPPGSNRPLAEIETVHPVLAF
jgi:integrase